MRFDLINFKLFRHRIPGYSIAIGFPALGCYAVCLNLIGQIHFGIAVCCGHHIFYNKVFQRNISGILYCDLILDRISRFIFAAIS